MAKENLLTKIDREGEISTDAFLLSNLFQAHGDLIVLIDDIDIKDPTLFFSLNIYISDDGVKWKHRAGMTCFGRNQIWDEPPSLGIPIQNIKGKYIQARLELNKQIKIGLDFKDRA